MITWYMMMFMASRTSHILIHCGTSAFSVVINSLICLEYWVCFSLTQNAQVHTFTLCRHAQSIIIFIRSFNLNCAFKYLLFAANFLNRLQQPSVSPVTTPRWMWMRASSEKHIAGASLLITFLWLGALPKTDALMKTYVPERVSLMLAIVLNML